MPLPPGLLNEQKQALHVDLNRIECIHQSPRHVRPQIDRVGNSKVVSENVERKYHRCKHTINGYHSQIHAKITLK